MKKQKGFSVIELLIVVAIILTIAAIAIPNFLKSKMAANESSALESMRTINTGQVAYAAACPSIGYSATLVELNTGAICAGGTGVIDNVLAAGTKSGYKFTYTPGAADASGVVSAYTNVAVPLNVGVTGQRGFYSDQMSAIRYSTDGSAPTVTSSALQ